MLDDRTVENEYDYLHNFSYQAIDVNGNIVFIPIIVAAVAVGALSGCSSLASYDPVNSEKNYVLSYEELYPLKAGVCGGFGEQIQWKHTDIPKGKYGIIAQTVKYSDVEFYIAGSNVNQKDKLTYGVTEFTEYWEIQHNNGTYVDVYLLTPKICSRGKLTIEADATLYVSDNKLTGANPPQPENHPSNTLPYNDGRRVLPGIRSNTVKRKTVKVEWNCLDGEVRETILG